VHQLFDHRVFSFNYLGSQQQQNPFEKCKHIIMRCRSIHIMKLNFQMKVKFVKFHQSLSLIYTSYGLFDFKSSSFGLDSPGFHATFVKYIYGKKRKIQGNVSSSNKK
jgi:hypothetical protein